MSGLRILLQAQHGARPRQTQKATRKGKTGPGAHEDRSPEIGRDAGRKLAQERAMSRKEACRPRTPGESQPCTIRGYQIQSSPTLNRKACVHTPLRRTRAPTYGFIVSTTGLVRVYARMAKNWRQRDVLQPQKAPRLLPLASSLGRSISPPRPAP